MKTRYLFPHSFKMIGWALLIPGVVFGLLHIMELNPFSELKVKVFSLSNPEVFDGKTPGRPFSWTHNDVMDELISYSLILGALLVGFSREKVEDEYIARIRLESLLWATYINYGILLISIPFIYGPGFFDVMIYNMFTLLLIFLLRFYLVLYRNAKARQHEEYA